MKYRSLIAYFFLYTLHTCQAMETTQQKNSEPSLATQFCLQGISASRVDIVKNGLLAGADVNYIDGQGESLFFKACCTNNKEIAELIGSHEQLNLFAQQDRRGPIPLHLACMYGFTNIIALILRKAPKTIHMKDRQKNCCLHYAADNGHEESINLLLSHNNTNINWQNDYGDTALHGAAQEKHLTCIKTLIMNGANPTIKNNQQVTPLLLLYSLLANNLNELNQFFTTNPDIADKLIHTTDEKGNNQFHLCSSIDAVLCNLFRQYLSFLLTQGLNIDARNKDGKRAVDLACEEYKTFYKLYIAKKLPKLKLVLTNQERVMHCFLCITSPLIQCTLFQGALQKKDLYDLALPTEIKRVIACLYYALNIETIVAKKYINNDDYYNDFIENKQAIRQDLLKNPEPHLLWSVS